ncbi:MAG: hypothetical protein K6B43_02030 [Treponema sp.]|nr:hypothetical protein [Treponema sp.]
MKKERIAKIIEWIGAAIILCGVVFFSVIYFKQISLTKIHHAILLWVLGFGIMCYAPISLQNLNARAKDADDAERLNDPEAGTKRKAATALKRSLALKIICGTVLIAYGFLKFFGIK